MIASIKKILGIKKTILLDVPDSFPTWHSCYGTDTHFAQKIGGRSASKIHAIKSNSEFWDSVCQKTATGNYKVKIVHIENTPDGKKYYLIKRCQRLHLQQAYFDKTQNSIVVDGKVVHAETIAKNEGYALDDFMELMHHLEERKFCIVHFTAFRY